MTTNHTAYLPARDAPLTIHTTPIPTPAPSELIVRVHSLAINPADWKLATWDLTSNPLFSTLAYPLVLGLDIAGTVHAVGSAVTLFSPGDRVLAGANGVLPQNNPRGGFQTYVAVREGYAGRIPESVAFEDAAVLPLGLITAARGLFEAEMLGMALPPGEAGKGKTLLVWGGSSSVGANAVQLAAAAGYDVVAVAGRRNFGLCKELGARAVVDYGEAGFEEAAAEALRGRETVGGLDAIGEEGTVNGTVEILRAAGAKRRVTSALPTAGELAPEEEGWDVKGIVAESERWEGEILPRLMGWVGSALEEGTMKAKPDAMVVGEGLESVQKGMDMLKAGVSGRKLVVNL